MEELKLVFHELFRGADFGLEVSALDALENNLTMAHMQHATPCETAFLETPCSFGDGTTASGGGKGVSLLVDAHTENAFVAVFGG